MSIRSALRTGLSMRFEDGLETFSRQLEQGEHPQGSTERIRVILERLPGDWATLDTITWEDDAPILARALYPMVTSYLLLEEDLIPSTGEQIVLGLLDDAYLLLKSLDSLEPSPQRKQDLALLHQVLGEGACAVLDALVAGALAEAAEEVARQQG